MLFHRNFVEESLIIFLIRVILNAEFLKGCGADEI